jgi:hypothetical protein
VGEGMMRGVCHIERQQWQDYIVVDYLGGPVDQQSMGKCIGQHVSKELIVGHEA